MIPPMELALHSIGRRFLTICQRLGRQPASGAKVDATVPLPAGVAWSIGGRPGMMVGCAKGKIWLTQTGDCRDIVLGVGMAFTSKRRGKLVVTALEPAVIARLDAKTPS